MLWGKHCLKMWSSTQATVALPSAEDFKRFAALRSKQQHLVDSDTWDLLTARFRLAMRSTNFRAINQLRKKHKNFILEAAFHKGHKAPMIATPESSSEANNASNTKPPTAKIAHVPIPATSLFSEPTKCRDIKSEERKWMRRQNRNLFCKPSARNCPTETFQQDVSI